MKFEAGYFDNGLSWEIYYSGDIPDQIFIKDTGIKICICWDGCIPVTIVDSKYNKEYKFRTILDAIDILREKYVKAIADTSWILHRLHSKD